MQYLIATHGTLASGFASALSVLLGTNENIHVVDCYVDASNPKEKIKSVIDSIGEQPVLMFSDIVGGSVNQILNEYCTRPNTYQISGANLAVMIEIIAQNRENWSKAELKETVENCKASLQLIEIDLTDSGDGDDFF